MKALKTFRSKAGFTLVELMVVVALMALCMTFFAMNISSASYKLRSTAFDLRASFQRARLESIKRNRNVYVDFDISNTGNVTGVVSLWVDVNRSGAPYQAGTDTLIESVSMFDVGTNTGDPVLAAPAPADGGPANEAVRDPITALANPEQGVKLASGARRVFFRPDGTNSVQGSIYMHSPLSLESGTYAVVLNNIGRTYARYYQPGAASWIDI